MKGRQAGCSGGGNRQRTPSGHDRDLDIYRGKWGAAWGSPRGAMFCRAFRTRGIDCPCGQDGSERDKRKGSLEDGVKTSESPSKQENGSQVCVRGGDRYRGGGGCRNDPSSPPLFQRHCDEPQKSKTTLFSLWLWWNKRCAGTGEARSKITGRQDIRILLRCAPGTWGDKKLLVDMTSLVLQDSREEGYQWWRVQ